MANFPIYSLAASLISVYLVYVYIIHPLFVSPLSKLPAAHWSCHISNFWILRARKKGAENALLHKAHRRLGNVVRVAPNTISADGVEAMRTIYQGGFPKAPWYRVFDNYGYGSYRSLLYKQSTDEAVYHACSQLWILNPIQQESE